MSGECRECRHWWPKGAWGFGECMAPVRTPQRGEHPHGMQRKHTKGCRTCGSFDRQGAR